MSGHRWGTRSADKPWRPARSRGSTTLGDAHNFALTYSYVCSSGYFYVPVLRKEGDPRPRIYVIHWRAPGPTVNGNGHQRLPRGWLGPGLPRLASPATPLSAHTPPEGAPAAVHPSPGSISPRAARRGGSRHLLAVTAPGRAANSLGTGTRPLV